MKPESDLARPEQPTARPPGSALHARQREPSEGELFLNEVDRSGFDNLTDALELAMRVSDRYAKGTADREEKRAELLGYFRQKYGVKFLRSVTESQERRNSPS